MKKLVLLRHGESLWNKENRFTGWKDVDLSPEGIIEAKHAGNILKENGFVFDRAFTSYLKRAIKTLWLTLDELDAHWITVEKSWRLNERHYGALQGLNKAETTALHGEEKVHIWRRSYDTPPPALDIKDERYPGLDPRYKHLTKEQLPLTECLKDTVERFLPYYFEKIEPCIKNGENVLIVAHGNSLRALIKYLDKISDDDISELNIPTATPLVYELSDALVPLKHYYLGDQNEIQAKISGVKNQTNKK